MTLTLHNSLSGKKEPFKPINPDRVTMYVCGPTVYDYLHIGNGRPAVVFDVLFRVLKSQYKEVHYAANVTDVDDKIIAASIKAGLSTSELTNTYIEAYNVDIRGLGVLPTTAQPRATQDMAQIIEMIEDLISQENAYEADGHVLFHVPSDPNYGQLSKRTLEDMLDGARVEVAPYKRDPKDFVLWKPSTGDQPGWDSPWGFGRPGWHIECSAMIKRHLGPSIDIHGGGSDLQFPHHENELAQSACANQAPFVGYWVHNGMLTFGGEKMSKSIGNIETIRSLLERHDGEVLRFALLSGQYRSALSWSEEQIEQAKSSIDRLYQALRVSAPTTEDGSANQVSDTSNTEHEKVNWDTIPEEVQTPLEDDLNTPGAIAALHAFASAIHKTEDKTELATLYSNLRQGGAILGILQRNPEQWFQSGASLEPAEIEVQIEARNNARKNKDFAGADKIRNDLLAAGIELEDSREGTIWRLKD